MIIFTLELSVPAGSAPPKSFFHPVFRTPGMAIARTDPEAETGIEVACRIEVGDADDEMVEAAQRRRLGHDGLGSQKQGGRFAPW